MEQEIKQVFFSLLRSAIENKKMSDAECIGYKREYLPTLISVAKKHDMEHLLAYGLEINGLLLSEDKGIKNYIMKAAYRYEQLNFALEELCDVLEGAKISFIPLKGSVMRKYYHEPWMRTSCDIDILVNAEDVDRAAECLVCGLGYKNEGKGSHDVSLFSPIGIHVELHYELVEDGLANRASVILSSFDKYIVKHEQYNYWLEFTDEMFYFYHIAHMAKHFINGGCGVRPFIDLWILDNLPNADINVRNILLEQGELLNFANAARRLSQVWLDNVAYDDITVQAETYILNGGVYGNIENQVMLQQQKKGGKLKYLISKIFLPYDIIKFHYPILQRKRWLMPFMQIRRWCKLIFCGHISRVTSEIKYNSDISSDEAAATKHFIESMGL